MVLVVPVLPRSTSSLVDELLLFGEGDNARELETVFGVAEADLIH